MLLPRFWQIDDPFPKKEYISIYKIENRHEVWFLGIDINFIAYGGIIKLLLKHKCRI
jgi:hypothetical protein